MSITVEQTLRDLAENGFEFSLSSGNKTSSGLTASVRVGGIWFHYAEDDFPNLEVACQWLRAQIISNAPGSLLAAKWIEA
jgi:hypothetical protein